jgi:acetyl/propionyl-CoA carboxylase alpha subunit
VALAEAVGYTSAGTVEFVVDGAGRFYLLEMNTRLQVEHPITELVTGVDLAAWQIRIAAGEALPFTQEALRQRGHAMECRVYAEDPAKEFLPSIGEITAYRRPVGPGIRVDDGVEMGAAVTPYYDPMVAKVVAWGADRPEAIRKMVRALGEMVVLGVTTNIPYLLAILQQPEFVAGRTTTNFIGEQMEGWRPDVEVGEADWMAAAAWEVLKGGSKRVAAVQVGDGAAGLPDPWGEVVGWRNVRD